MSRIDDLPERAILRKLRDARQVAAELKGSPQRVGGANLAYSVSESGATYDWVGRLDSLLFSGGGKATLVVTLTSATAKVPLSDIALDIFYSTDGVNYNLYPMEAGLLQSMTGGSPSITHQITPLVGSDLASNKAAFSCLISGVYNSRVAVKASAYSIDDVSISVERVD